MAGNQSLNTFPNVGHLFSGIIYIFFRKLYTHLSLNEKLFMGKIYIPLGIGRRV